MRPLNRNVQFNIATDTAENRNNKTLNNWKWHARTLADEQFTIFTLLRTALRIRILLLFFFSFFSRVWSTRSFEFLLQMKSREDREREEKDFSIKSETFVSTCWHRIRFMRRAKFEVCCCFCFYFWSRKIDARPLLHTTFSNFQFRYFFGFFLFAFRVRIYFQTLRCSLHIDRLNKNAIRKKCDSIDTEVWVKRRTVSAARWKVVSFSWYLFSFNCAYVNMWS